MDKVYCVYILTNQRNTVLYTGVTGELKARVQETQTSGGLGKGSELDLVTELGEARDC